MKWSRLKKLIEDRMADSVRDRVDLGSTAYRKAHDQTGRGWLLIDKREVLNMCTITFEIEMYQMGGYTAERYEQSSKELREKNIFAQWDWHESLFDYLNLSIDDVLCSENPIIRAMGMLDARVGKRRLKVMDVSSEHDLVKRLYDLRCDAEDLSKQGYKPDLSSHLDQPRSWQDIGDEEYEEYEEEQQKAQDKLARSNKMRKIQNLIRSIYRGELVEEELDTPISREIFDGFRRSDNPSILYQALLHLDSRSKLMRSFPHVRGVIALSQESSNWLRPVQEWIPSTHNPAKQFSSLARHLWANYEVPRFMDSSWLIGDVIQQQWFKHLGMGNNIRTAEHLPLQLTKKMAHNFSYAPESYSIEQAFRWAQVQALGGNRRLVDALLETRIINDFRDNEFWLSVFRFFINNPMLDTVHISPIIDYIWNQRYEPRIVFVERGVAEELGPEQPNFSMRGRTVHSLLRAVDDWHRRLGKEIAGGQLQWKKSGIEDFVHIEGTKASKNMTKWSIRELLSSQELVSEGRQMRHCVATYAQSCHSGVSSIWTMDLETADGTQKLLTIEIHNESNEIRQIRGIRNRFPTEKEKEIIKRWAAIAGLEFASYL